MKGPIHPQDAAADLFHLHKDGEELCKASNDSNIEQFRQDVKVQFSESQFWRGPIEDINSFEIGHLLNESKVDKNSSQTTPSKHDSIFKPFNYGALFPFDEPKIKTKPPVLTEKQLIEELKTEMNIGKVILDQSKECGNPKETIVDEINNDVTMLSTGLEEDNSTKTAKLSKKATNKTEKLKLGTEGNMPDTRILTTKTNNDLKNNKLKKTCPNSIDDAPPSTTNSYMFEVIFHLFVATLSLGVKVICNIALSLVKPKITKKGIQPRKTLGEANILGWSLEKLQVNAILGFFGLSLTASQR